MQNDPQPGMKAEGLQDFRDPDFDTFLAANFDDFQGFPWRNQAISTLPAELDQVGLGLAWVDCPCCILFPSDNQPKLCFTNVRSPKCSCWTPPFEMT